MESFGFDIVLTYIGCPRVEQRKIGLQLLKEYTSSRQGEMEGVFPRPYAEVLFPMLFSFLKPTEPISIFSGSMINLKRILEKFAVSSAYFVKNNAMKKFFEVIEIISKLFYDEFRDIIIALCFLEPIYISNCQNAFDIMFKMLNDSKGDLDYKYRILRALKNVVKVSKNIIPLVTNSNGIDRILHEKDPEIVKLGMYFLKKILINCNPNVVGEDGLFEVIDLFQKPEILNDMKCVRYLYSCLYNLSNNDDHGKYISKRVINYSSALLDEKALQHFLSTGQVLMPSFIYDKQWNKCESIGKHQVLFAGNIEKVLIKAFTKSIRFEESFFPLLAKCFSLTQTTPPLSFFITLYYSTISYDKVEDVITLAFSLINSSGVYSYPIIPNLLKKKLMKSDFKMHTMLLNHLVQRYRFFLDRKPLIKLDDLNSTDSLIDFIKTNFSYHYYFADISFLEHSYNILKEEKVVNRSIFHIQNMALLVLLTCIREETRNTKNDDFLTSSYIQKESKVDFIVDGERTSHYICVAAPSIYSEWKLNESKIEIDEIRNVMKNHGRLGEIVKPCYLDADFILGLSYICRYFHVPKYKYFQFSKNGNIFPNESLLFNNSNPTCFVAKSISIESTIQQSASEISYEFPEKANCCMNILSLCHSLSPRSLIDIDSYLNESYHDSIKNIVSGQSLHVNCICKYPELFSFESRKFAFYSKSLYSIPLLLYLRKVRDEKNPPWWKKCNIPMKCWIRRNSIWEDGVLLLNSFAKSVLYLEINFEDEVGFGDGPTQEFFSLLALEFTKTCHKMWQNENQQNEYCQSSNGIFPNPEADASLFYLFGVLCAKAISMNLIIPIDFNPEFFNLLIKNSSNPENVDPAVYRNIQCYENCQDLAFLFPGTQIELKMGGANIFVDESNYEEYKQLVIKFLGGQVYVNQINAFHDGLKTNLKTGNWNVLSPEEFQKILCGEPNGITKEDLKEGIQLEGGYNASSRVILWMFDYIEKLKGDNQQSFLEFVTGCKRLPPGGIKNLTPKLSITKRIQENPDSSLPSVSTCFHNIKLPEYSSQQILEKKFNMAITEGRDSFQLS